MTLTINPKLYNAPRDAFEVTSPHVAHLIRELRTRFGDIEYLRVTEVTKHGWPHYHLLLRSSYLPQPVVKAIWERLTGATIVDLRQVDKSWSSYWYLLKYLSKMHDLQWTERHVSTSRKFFPPSGTPEKPKKEIINRKFEPIHPLLFLANHYTNVTVFREAPTSWYLEGNAAESTRDINPAELGLPGWPIQKPQQYDLLV